MTSINAGFSIFSQKCMFDVCSSVMLAFQISFLNLLLLIEASSIGDNDLGNTYSLISEVICVHFLIQSVSCLNCVRGCKTFDFSESRYVGILEVLMVTQTITQMAANLCVHSKYFYFGYS